MKKILFVMFLVFIFVGCQNKRHFEIQRNAEDIQISRSINSEILMVTIVTGEICVERKEGCGDSFVCESLFVNPSKGFTFLKDILESKSTLTNKITIKVDNFDWNNDRVNPLLEIDELCYFSLHSEIPKERRWCVQDPLCTY